MHAPIQLWMGRRQSPVLRVSARPCVSRHMSVICCTLTRKHQDTNDVRSRRCQHSGCLHQLSYGWEGEKPISARKACFLSPTKYDSAAGGPAYCMRTNTRMMCAAGGASTQAACTSPATDGKATKFSSARECSSLYFTYLYYCCGKLDMLEHRDDAVQTRDQA